MRFAEPWWLLALPAAWLAVLLIVRFGRRTVPARQHRWAVWLRLVVVTLLVASLAQPLWIQPVEQTTVLFLVDRSASVSDAARQVQEDFLSNALEASEPDDISGVVVFGAESRIDAALAAGRVPESIRTVVDDNATDIASALRASSALLPSEGSRRIVLLTDAVETVGNARQAAEDLAEDGVAVDIITLETARSADALVESVDLPNVVREGDLVPVQIRVRANEAGPATIIVSSEGGEELVVQADLEPGVNTIEVEIPAEQTGPLVVEARVDAGFDTRTENDFGQGLTRVLGPARVALVEGRVDEADELQAALTAGGVNAEIIGSIPDEAGLLAYDAVVLVNVPAPDEETAESLRAYVEDLGRGLVTIGGDQAYGLGGYQDTALEEILPVRSNPDDLIRRQPVAEVIVIDTSGSMGVCHCRDGGFSEGGVNKTDISRAGAALAIDALSPSDQVGVIAVSSGTSWVIPLGERPSTEDAEAALASLFAAGDTEIAVGLRAALEELRGVPDALRHIVLFTDGWDPNENGLLPIAREIADAGITLSVLGTGEGPGTTLQRMASIGGGRYYPGRDLASIPEIFVEETLTVARNLAQEGVFSPVLSSPSQVTAELSESPPLFGYVLTRSKASASVPLEVGEADPLLATWQRGLGRASSWTSDATTRWLQDWVPWSGYVDFWGRVVRDVLPADLSNPPEVRISDGALNITYEPGETSLQSAAIARVRGPDGELLLVPLQRESETTYSASVPITAAGAYWVGVSVEEGGATLTSASAGVVSSYEEEFAFREADPTLAADMASLAQGRVDPEPASVWDEAPRLGSAELPLWPWLVGIALVLFLIDVTLRRLVVAEGDAQIWRATMVDMVRRPDEPDEIVDPETGERIKVVRKEQETVDRLLQRKRR